MADQPIAPVDLAPEDIRPFIDLSTSGLLWLINATVFHPRGYALSIVVGADGQAAGWRLLGDGSEPWRFDADMDHRFAAANATFAEAAFTVRNMARSIQLADDRRDSR